jgi:hypothetical protein
MFSASNHLQVIREMDILTILFLHLLVMVSWLLIPFSAYEFLILFMTIATIVSIGGFLYLFYYRELKFGHCEKNKKLLANFAIAFVWMIAGILHYTCGFKYEQGDETNCPKSSSRVLHLVFSVISCGLVLFLLITDTTNSLQYEKLKREET